MYRYRVCEASAATPASSSTTRELFAGPFSRMVMSPHKWNRKKASLPPRGGAWVFRWCLPSFFNEILFFWKLVSHGGLDFSIFVSSTI